MVRIIKENVEGGNDMMVLLSEEEFRYKFMMLIGIIIFLTGMVV